MSHDPSTPISEADPGHEISEPELQLLLQWNERHSTYGWVAVLAASLAIHGAVFLAVLQMPVLVTRHEAPARRVVVHKIPLYLPPDLLTQKTPNRREVSKSIDLADLLSTPSQAPQKASPKRSNKSFEIAKQVAAPAPSKTAPPPPAPQILPQLPATQTTIARNIPPPAPSTRAAPSLPPPTPAAPKTQSMPFQNIDSDPPDNPNPSLRPPKINFRNDASALPSTQNGRHTVLSDDNPNEEALGTPGVVGNVGERHAAVELKSDPQGADFKPYLTRILAIVRSNWKRVIPESVRTGALSGRTTLEFIITRDGKIPKMVTANSSGSAPLDRAAVAGLSMSNPLPPLPDDYKGYQVKLAFSFDYNMPAAR